MSTHSRRRAVRNDTPNNRRSAVGTKTVRQSARDHEPLSGTDAFWLEAALTQVESELAEVREPRVAPDGTIVDAEGTAVDLEAWALAERYRGRRPALVEVLTRAAVTLRALSAERSKR